MTDHDALLHAILANPDDDTARLIFADFIQEDGDDERAEFIRGQIELARTPDWEPFAVRWRRASIEAQAGDKFRERLPWHNSWNPRFPFHRGFGYAVKTDVVQKLLDHGDELFASAPIGELHLPPGSMQEYEEFARQPWLTRVESVRFWTLETPTFPVRALSASPLATRLKSIYFQKASSPGMSFLVESLFQSPLGRQLRDLTFHVGDGSQLDLVEALESGGETNLERLTFDNMGFDDIAAERLGGSSVLKTLRELNLANMHFADVHLDALFTGRLRNLQHFAFRNMGLRTNNLNAIAALANRVRFPNLRKLDFSKSYPVRDLLPNLIRKLTVGLRSLLLGGIRLGEGMIREIVTAAFWPYLVELDLSENELDDGSARVLLTATPPKELVTLDLRGNPGISPQMAEQLAGKYGEAVVIS